MLFLLSFIYLFHGFQTHASPLTYLLAEPVGNITTNASTSACVCPADQRSIWNILWSSLAVIFACSWVSVHPNISAPNESGRRILLRRLELMFWAVVGPELLISWAFRQWSAARRLEKLYKERGWTRTHGYFIQMGGFMLFEGEDAKGVLSAEKLNELLEAKKIDFPTVTVEEIEDRSKADGFSKAIALGQTLWFVVQCIARRAEDLDITPVELLALSLAVLNGAMYFLWWHKPLDVRCPVRVHLLNRLDEPNEAVESSNFDRVALPILNSVFLETYSDASERLREVNILWQSSLPILCKVLISITWTILVLPLLALIVPILFPFALLILSLYPVLRWIAILIPTSVDTGDMKVPTFYASEIDDAELPIFFFVMFVTGAAFGGIHCAGWFFTFPSHEEAVLWRVCSVILTCMAFILPLLIMLIALSNSRGFRLFVTRIAFFAFTVYVLSRLLLLVEAFISLRNLTPGMLAPVKWAVFIPHI